MLREQMGSMIDLFQYVSLDMMWSKPMPDWEFVRDVVRPTFGERVLKADLQSYMRSPLTPAHSSQHSRPAQH